MQKTISVIIAVVIAAIVIAALAASHPVENGSMQQGGLGKSFMGQREAESLLGAGTYSVQGPFSPANQSAAGIISMANQGSLNGNVTSYWLVSYNTTGPKVKSAFGSTNPGMTEYVFVTNNTGAVYPVLVYSYISGFNERYNVTLKWVNVTALALNISMGGMTYSYLQGFNKSYSTPIAVLVGHKGDEVALVEIGGENVSEQPLAAIVSNDLP